MISKNRITQILIGFICSILGFYSSSFEYFKFNPEINLVDFSSLIITSTIGLYIAISVQKNITNEKSEKDFLINEISQVKTELKAIYTGVLNDNLEFSDTVFRFKISSSNLSTIKDLFEICNIDDNSKINQISTTLKSLKRIITNSSTVQNKLLISDDDKNLFFNNYRKLTKQFSELIVYINRR
jgi:hypothetical protein